MAAPSIRSFGTVTSGSTGTPSFAEPAGAVADDLIVCIWFQDDARTSIGTPPAGFAAPTDAPQANNPLTGSSPDHSLQVYIGRRSVVGAGPYTFTVVPGLGGATPFCEGRAVAVQDVPPSVVAPFVEAADGNTSGSTSSTTAPAVSATSLGLDRLALYAATNWSGGAWTEPAGYTEDWDANNRIATIDHLTMPAPATTSPQAVCAGSNRTNAWVGIFISATAAESGHKPRIPLPLLRALLTRRQALLDALQAVAQITLADSASETETLTVSASAALADTGTAADAAAIAAAVPIGDTAAASDTATVTAGVPLADTAAAADAIAATASATLADTAAAADSATVAATTGLADSATAVDALTVSVTVALGDSGSAADTLLVGTPIALADSASTVDMLVIAAQASLADVGTAVDTLTVIVQAALVDAAAALDDVAVDATLTLTDTGTAVDAATGADDSIVAKTLADGGVAVDRLHVVIMRPDTGLVLRPDLGVVVRPDMGTVERP